MLEKSHLQEVGRARRKSSVDKDEKAKPCHETDAKHRRSVRLKREEKCKWAPFSARPGKRKQMVRLDCTDASPARGSEHHGRRTPAMALA